MLPLRTISKDVTFATIAYIREELGNKFTCYWLYSPAKKHKINELTKELYNRENSMLIEESEKNPIKHTS